MGATPLPVCPSAQFAATRPAHIPIPAQVRRLTVTQVVKVNPTTGEEFEASDASEATPNMNIEVDGMSIAVRANKPYLEGTDKPTILMVHGLAYTSYCFRYLLDDLEQKLDWPAVAFDWPGHGSSDKPSPSRFPYTEEAYYKVFEKVVEKLVKKKPFFMVVQGYILSQIGLLYPVRNPDDVDRMVFHSVPLDPEAKLRPEF